MDIGATAVEAISRMSARVVSMVVSTCKDQSLKRVGVGGSKG